MGVMRMFGCGPERRVDGKDGRGSDGGGGVRMPVRWVWVREGE